MTTIKGTRSMEIVSGEQKEMTTEIATQGKFQAKGPLKLQSVNKEISEQWNRSNIDKQYSIWQGMI